MTKPANRPVTAHSQRLPPNRALQPHNFQTFAADPVSQNLLVQARANLSHFQSLIPGLHFPETEYPNGSINRLCARLFQKDAAGRRLMTACSRRHQTPENPAAPCRYIDASPILERPELVLCSRRRPALLGHPYRIAADPEAEQAVAELLAPGFAIARWNPEWSWRHPGLTDLVAVARPEDLTALPLQHASAIHWPPAG